MFLLQRNWFMDPQDVYSLLWELDEDVYSDVYDMRHTLPIELQSFFPDAYPKTKYTVVNIPESTWESEMLKQHDTRLRNIQKFKKTFVAPPRPREWIDTRMDSLRDDISNKTAILEDMIRLTAKSKKYVPPGQRTQADEDPMVRDMRNTIKNRENEFDMLKEQATTLDSTWTELKCLDAMLDNAGNLSRP